MEEQRLERLEKIVLENNEMLKQILKSADTVCKTNAKMSEHIDFVEDVYAVVRTPLDFIRRNVSSFITGGGDGGGGDGGEDVELPQRQRMMITTTSSTQETQD